MVARRDRGDAVSTRLAYEDALAGSDDLDVLADAADFYIANAEGFGAEWMERGLQLARMGSKLAMRDRDEDWCAEFAILEATALTQLGDPRASLSRLDSALHALGDHPDLLVQRGIVLFELCRFREAREQLRRALSENEDAWARHTLGLVEERLGHAEEADRHFHMARRIDPEEFGDPINLSPGEFEDIVEHALRELPHRIAEYLSNVAITVEDFPAEEELLASEPPLSPSILGIFRGAPLQEKASMDPWSYFPSGIALYQKNLERFARDRAGLVDEIRVTLLHEVGHFLGMDEHDLWERDLD